MSPTNQNNHPSSFRDPSGFIFIQNGKIYRQINKIYQDDYNMLMNSGLYRKLTDGNLLVPHKESSAKGSGSYYKIIEVQKIPFISYPYEWCFSQLKDAALLTLKVMKTSLEFNMVLKDATSFNIQFLNGKPVFIDTLSFERYHEGKPWVAYKQFCEQFMAPLALSAYTDFRLTQLMKNFPGSVPLDLATKLLPFKAKFNPGIFMHLIMHAKSQKNITEISDKQKKQKSFTEISLLGLLDSLENTLRKLNLPQENTVWGNYTEDGRTPSYSGKSQEEKKKLVSEFITVVKPKTAWDMGANTGMFSRLDALKKTSVVSMDFDYIAVEKNYLDVKKTHRTNILPLIMDLTNPSPGIGWNNEERDPLSRRPHPDLILALALVHHLAIANNLPLSNVAEYFSNLTGNLIIEFVPKTDKQVQVLLSSREDIFDKYTQNNFETDFLKYFHIKQKKQIPGSQRTLYLMEKK